MAGIAADCFFSNKTIAAMPTNPIIQAILDSPAGKLNQHLFSHTGNMVAKTGKKIKNTKPKDKTKNWIKLILKAFAEGNDLSYLEEYQFDETQQRKWRFDFALMRLDGTLAAAIEFEGLMSKKSRHTTATGYTGDTDKYRAAALQGITVLRYTILNYKDLSADLMKIKL